VLECLLLVRARGSGCHARYASYEPTYGMLATCATPKRGKGTHMYWEHPKLPGYSVTVSGHDGDDAQAYQEKAVREAREQARGVK
jgi:predicted RNA binding protein YcfA (HicA-like mRNA interferase family)